jgi:hypothetical protein
MHFGFANLFAQFVVLETGKAAGFIPLRQRSDFWCVQLCHLAKHPEQAGGRPSSLADLLTRRPSFF